jgi:hypothetical protein
MKCFKENSRSFEDQVPPGEVFEDEGEGFILGLRGEGGCVVDVVCLLVCRANYDCPVALEDVLELDFDFLAGLVLVVTLLLCGLLDEVDDHVFDVGLDFWPFDWAYFGLKQFLILGCLLHEIIMMAGLHTQI